MSTNNNFRVKNGLEVANTATLGSLMFISDGISITSRSELIGSQGDIGYTGSQGPQGDQGPQGIQGDIGYTGSTGAQGDIGYTGSTGAQGDIGYTGSQGTQGNIGYTGSSGTNGADGATGYTGSRGDIGPAGIPGNTGTSGSFTGTTIYPIVTSDVTQSTTVGTGSIIGAGGLGITKNAYVGGLISVAGILYAGDGSNATLANNGAARITGGLGVSRDIVAGGLITAGRADATAGTGEGVTNGFYSNIFVLSSKKTITNTTAEWACQIYNSAGFRTSKHLYQIMQGTITNVHCGELLITHINGNIYMTESNVITSNVELGTWRANYDASNVTLYFTPISSSQMTVKISSQLISL